jgi:hypothetical protein
MEVSVGDYGRMIFEMMVAEKHLPDHWQSIKAEAEPLVRKLLALNAKMSNGGYEIHGHNDKGKKVLSAHEKIKAAQSRCLVPARDLREGDRFWLFDDYNDTFNDDHPFVVEDVTKRGIYYEARHLGGRHTERIDSTEMILKAPDCFKNDDEHNDRKQREFRSDKYWLNLYETTSK